MEKENLFKKYAISPNDIDMGIRRILSEAYATSIVCDEPELIYIAAGPGAGKSSVERYFKRKLNKEGKDPFIINSDKIAMFHKYYDELLELPPNDCYVLSRQFVRPATPTIFDELRKNRISLINENTLDKGEADIQQAKAFKDAGYKISVNVIATDLYESRLSCFEREATALQMGETPRGCAKENQLRMYNGFISGIKTLDEQGLIDEINIYIRGENIAKPPVLVYKKGDTNYRDFQEAIDVERQKQRLNLFRNPSAYFSRMQRTRETISTLGHNPKLTRNALEGLEELERDFAVELSKYLAAPDKYFEGGTSKKQSVPEER